MSGNFESMVNEMVRWNATPEVKVTPADETSESENENEDEDEDEDDLEDETSPWPSSGRSGSTGPKGSPAR
jgi:hypothetical protein